MSLKTSPCDDKKQISLEKVSVKLCVHNVDSLYLETKKENMNTENNPSLTKLDTNIFKTVFF